jgi:uncharacterized protein YndB with AHSA1/START domain
MRVFTIAAAAGGVLFAASAAQALDVAKSIDIAAPPEKVWAAIGDFCGIASWHPAVEKCELEKKGTDTFRTLSLKGGGTIREQQTGWSDQMHTYSYSILESPLPVANYVSTITVAPKGGGSTVSWTSIFDAKGASDADAQGAIEGIYNAGLESLKGKF